MQLLQLKQLKQFAILQHIKTKTHQNKIKDFTWGTSSSARTDNTNQEYDQNEARNTIATESAAESKNLHKFYRETCEAFLSADIPLNKLSNPKFKKYLCKYTGKNIPDQSTLRKYYVQEAYQSKLSSLRKLAAGQKIWVSLDETTDVEQRYIVCLVFGIMGIEEERENCYLANLEIL